MAQARDSRGRFTSGSGSSSGGTNVGSIYVEIGADLSKFTSGLQQAQASMKSTGQSMMDVGKTLSLNFSAPLAGISALFMKVGTDFEKSYNTIRTTTGKTGEELQSLETSYKKVFGSMGAPAEMVAKTIGDLSARLDLTGKPLEDLTKQIVKLARITKEDLATVIPAITRTFGDWSVSTEKQSETLDFLFKVSQKTGISFTALGERLTYFGGPMRQMGFDLEQTAVLLGKFEKEGVNVDLVMGSLRIALAKMAKEGIKDPATAFVELINRIKEAKTEGEKTTLAVKTFGAKAGPDMKAAISEGRFEIEALLNSIKSSGETINKAAADTSTLAGKFATLTNKISVALEPLGTKLLDIMEKSFVQMTPIFDSVIQAVSGLIESFLKVDPAIQAFVISFVTIGASIGPAIVVIGGLITALGSVSIPAIAAGTAITGIIAGITAFISSSPDFQKTLDASKISLSNFSLPVLDLSNSFSSMADYVNKLSLESLPTFQTIITSLTTDSFPVLVDIFKTIVTDVLPSIAEKFDILTQTVLPPFLKIIDDIYKIFLDKFEFISTDILPSVLKAFNEWLPGIKDIWNSLVELIGLAVGTIGNAIQSSLDAYKGYFDATWPYIKQLTMDIWEGIKGVIGGVIKVIQGVLNTFLGLITGDWDRWWKGIVQVTSGVWDIIRSTIVAVVKVIGDAIVVWLAGLVNIWKQQWNVLSNFVTSIVDTIKVTIQGMIDYVAQGIDAIFNFNNQQFDKKTIQVEYQTSQTQDSYSIPQFATGVQNFKGGYALVGESGPEVVKLPSGSDVIPNNQIAQSPPQIIIQNMTVRSDTDIQLIAKQINNYFKQTSRGLGVMA